MSKTFWNWRNRENDQEGDFFEKNFVWTSQKVSVPKRDAENKPVEHDGFCSFRTVMRIAVGLETLNNRWNLKANQTSFLKTDILSVFDKVIWKIQNYKFILPLQQEDLGTLSAKNEFAFFSSFTQ